MHDKLTKQDIELMEKELEDRRLNIRPQIIEGAKRTGMEGLVFYQDMERLRHELRSLGVNVKENEA